MPRKRASALRMVGVASQKGGAGKTTIGVHLAVLAHGRGQRVAIVDADPQGSASSWWRRRVGDGPEMVVASPGHLPQVLKEAREKGIDLLIVDTAPAHGEDIEALARVADFLVIPCRPGPLDLDAIGPTVELIARSRKAAGIILNACPPGRGSRESSITLEARGALANSPVPVAPVSIGQRVSLSHALITGQAVSEFEPKGKATQEFKALWKWIEERL